MLFLKAYLAAASPARSINSRTTSQDFGLFSFELIFTLGTGESACFSNSIWTSSKFIKTAPDSFLRFSFFSAISKSGFNSSVSLFSSALSYV